jgi:hypothetical protein
MNGYGGFEIGLEDERGLGFENEEEEEKILRL